MAGSRSAYRGEGTPGTAAPHRAAARVAGSPARRRPQGREKKTPAVITAIEQLLVDDTAGDPMSTLKWTRRTTGTIAQELGRVGITVSRRTVGRLLLHELHYSLRVNRKQLGTDSSPDRDRQFRYITQQRREFARRGDPIISVDTKKRAPWAPSRIRAPSGGVPVRVNDHDFPSDSNGVAIPYGVF